MRPILFVLLLLFTPQAEEECFTDSCVQCELNCLESLI